MRKYFLRAILFTILTSSLFTALGAGIYVIVNFRRELSQSIDRSLDEVQNRVAIFSYFLDITYSKMNETARAGLKEFSKKYPAGSFSAIRPEDLKNYASRLGFDELYVIGRNGVIVASSLPGDLDLDLMVDESSPFSQFLLDTFGKDTLRSLGVTVGIRTRKVNYYHYYSPAGSDYIYESSTELEPFLVREFGHTFYRDFISELFDDSMKNIANMKAATVFAFDDAGPAYLFGSALPGDIDQKALLTVDIGKDLITFEWPKIRAFRKIETTDRYYNLTNNYFGYVEMDASPMLSFVLKMTLLLTCICILTSAVAYFAARDFFDRKFLRRIESLSLKIHCVRDGDYSADFSDDRRDELAVIGKDVSVMIATILARESKLRESQRTEMLGVLAAGIVHDFRNMLTAIAGTASLLKEEARGNDGNLVEEVEDAAKMISDAAYKASNLVNDLLSVAKITERPFEKLDIGKLLDDAVRLCRMGLDKKIRIEFPAPAESMHISGDAVRLRQVFLNLLINAGQALQDFKHAQSPQHFHGLIRVELRTCVSRSSGDDTRRKLPSAEPSPVAFCEVAVEDSGPGLAPSIGDNLFTPFLTTKDQGTGLGLATALSVVTAHGGNISYRKSELGGASFVVTLPLLGPAG